jgi:hypothetical protein
MTCVFLTEHPLIEKTGSHFSGDAPQTKMAPRVHRGAIVLKEGSDYQNFTVRPA